MPSCCVTGPGARSVWVCRGPAAGGHCWGCRGLGRVVAKARGRAPAVRVRGPCPAVRVGDWLRRCCYLVPGFGPVLVCDRGPWGWQSESVPPVAGSCAVDVPPVSFSESGRPISPGVAAESVLRARYCPGASRAMCPGGPWARSLTAHVWGSVGMPVPYLLPTCLTKPSIPTAASSGRCKFLSVKET